MAVVCRSELHKSKNLWQTVNLCKKTEQQVAKFCDLFKIHVFILSLLLLSCKGSNLKPDIGYGKSYFYKNCSACHSPLMGFKITPSLFTLNSLDSLTLLEKLNSVKKDTRHLNYFDAKNYSSKEIMSVNAFIKYFFRTKY